MWNAAILLASLGYWRWPKRSWVWDVAAPNGEDRLVHLRDAATNGGLATEEATSAWVRKEVFLYRESSPGCRDNGVDTAERICAGQWPMLGLGWLELDFPPEWDRFFCGIQSEGAICSDARAIWELGRCHGVVWLAQAYADTGNPTFADAAVRFITGWQEKTRGREGIHWQCPMEVALRAMNWVAAMALLTPCESLGSQWRSQAEACLAQHGAHLIRNLEFLSPRSGNHLLADLAGLVYLGYALPLPPESRYWREVGLNGLVREIEDQIEPDGSHREGSPAYHALVCELVVWPLLLATSQGWKMPERTGATIKRMLDYLEAIVDEHGCPPNIADSDSGHVHEFGGPELDPVRRADARPILALGRDLLRRAGTDTPAAPKRPRWFTRRSRAGSSGTFGSQGVRGESCLQGQSGNYFPNAGLAILSLAPWRVVCCLGTPRPDGRYTHRHNDLLSFELHASGAPLVVDSGTYLYTGDRAARDFFRGTFAHSTLAIDDQEQHVLGSDPFVIHKYRGSQVRRWEVTDRRVVLDAEHRSYRRLSGRPVHRRRWIVENDPPRIRIEDEVTGRGVHKLTWRFPLAPSNCEVDLQRQTVRVVPNEGPSWLLQWDHPEVSVALAEGAWSRIYAKKDPVPVIRAEMTERLPARVTWDIELSISAPTVLSDTQHASGRRHD